MKRNLQTEPVVEAPKVQIRVIRNGEAIQLVQPISPKGIPLCCWCSKPIPKGERSTYRADPNRPDLIRGEKARNYFCGVTHAGHFGLWVAQQLYPAVAQPKLCPVCQDGACETKSLQCGKPSRA